MEKSARFTDIYCIPSFNAGTRIAQSSCHLHMEVVAAARRAKLPKQASPSLEAATRESHQANRAVAHFREVFGHRICRLVRQGDEGAPAVGFIV